MEFIEAAKKYIVENDPNHWLTKDLVKIVEKNKEPAWAVKELEKKGYLENQIEQEQEQEEEIQDPYYNYDAIDHQWAIWVEEDFDEPQRSQILKELESKYKDKPCSEHQKIKVKMTDEDFKMLDQAKSEAENELKQELEKRKKEKEIQVEKVRKERELAEKQKEAQSEVEVEPHKEEEITPENIQNKKLEEFLKPQVVGN